MKHTRHFLIAATCLFSVAASAQWQWVDKDGRKVFSDRAPPVEIPEKNILKRPGSREAATSPSAAGDLKPTGSDAPSPGAAAPKLSGVDQELLQKKRKAEEAETARRNAEKEKILIAKVENCARAKQVKANLSSNIRLVQINEKGERVVIDDAKRAEELKRAQSVIDSDC